jgi:signal transduction histidine kinase
VKDNYTRRLVKDKQSIQIVFDSRIEPFAFDAHKINQVLDNLIENSFRYAPEFREITIKATLLDEDNMIECSVSDDGPGIPEKNLPHIFERFYRVDKGRSREEGGTGLGLSILKHIILLHGGAVRAKSIFGEGAEILFTLPYRKALDE